MSQSPSNSTSADEEAPVLRLTHGAWRRLLEQPSFLDNDDNRFQPPRRYLGRRVEIIPAQGGGD